MILDKIVASTKTRVEIAKKNISFQQIVKLTNKANTPFIFEQSLIQKDISFICEVKKASPSKGIIAFEFPYIEIAKEYEKVGACAISVLTEPDFFMGSVEYLMNIKRYVSIPVLQKDFIIDEYQIYEASVIGADAILLICALLDMQQLKHFIEIADSLGLSCLVEAHDEHEVEQAIQAGARIIGVNNRNLKTFDVDIQNSIKLRSMVPESIIFVSESGVREACDIEQLRKAGVNAVLIGETFMTSKDKRKMLNSLRGYHYD